MEFVISITISFLALLVSFIAERRSRSFQDQDFYESILDLASDIKMSLEILYANVLTLDLLKYRSEFKDIVLETRSKLPAIITQIDHILKRIVHSQNKKELKKIDGELRLLQKQARTIAESISFGIERGSV